MFKNDLLLYRIRIAVLLVRKVMATFWSYSFVLYNFSRLFGFVC